MISRFLLLVLLVLPCVQSFTKAESQNGPETCCFSYQRNPIPIRVITGFKVTDRHCPKPAVIFTLKNKHQVCVDPELEWVQKHMKSLDQILNERLNKPHTSVKSSIQQSSTTTHNSNVSDSCCFRYQRTPIPIRNITGYNVTDHHCAKPAVIFTLKNSHHVCVDPELQWVQNHMKSLDQILNERLNKPQTSVRSSLQQSSTTTHNSKGEDSCCLAYQRTPIPTRVITGYEVTEHQCAKPGVIFILKNSHRVCVYPELKWVQKCRKRIDQILNKSLIQTPQNV